MKNKSLLALLAIPLAGLGVVGSVAFAQSNAQTTSPAPATVQQTTLAGQAQELQNGLPEGKELADSEISDAQEQQALQAKAKITADQAKAAAQAQVSGTVSSVQLGDENGTVVYEVIIGNQEVKVNAVDGSIVKIEAAETENGSENEQMTTGHGNEPNDGAQVSDGDGETNDNGTPTGQ